MQTLSIDYSPAGQGVTHTREVFASLSLEYVSAADELNASVSGKTVTITETVAGVENTYTSDLRYQGFFYGDPINNYLPTSSLQYSIDSSGTYGFSISIAPPAFPDISSFVNDQYTSETAAMSDFSRYIDAADDWYNQVDSLYASQAQFGDSNGVLANFSVGQPTSLLQVSRSPTQLFDYDTTLTGSAHNDVLRTYSGDDILTGGDGVNTLDAGAGDDELYGGANNDTLIGGAGNDYFEGIGVTSSSQQRGDNVIDGSDYTDFTTTDTVEYKSSASIYDDIQILFDLSGSISWGVRVTRDGVGSDTIKNWNQIKFTDTTITESKISEKGVIAFAIWALDNAFDSVSGFIGRVLDYLNAGGDTNYAKILKWFEIADAATDALAQAITVDDKKAAVKIVVSKAVNAVVDPVFDEAETKITDFLNQLPLPGSTRNQAEQAIQNGVTDLRTKIREVTSTVFEAAIDAASDVTTIDWNAKWQSWISGVQQQLKNLYEEPAFSAPKDQFQDPQLDPQFDEPGPIISPLSSTTLDGTNGNDVLIGSSAHETFYAKSGDDVVIAGAGNDTIIAGSGEGNDLYFGGSGLDTVTFGSTTQGVSIDLRLMMSSGVEIGADSLDAIENVTGGSGDDTIIGDTFSNELRGAGGDDEISGEEGMDSLFGNGGNDEIFGGFGSDTLFGQAGEDFLRGGNDADLLNGGGGDDDLLGDAGDDTLLGGDGADTLNGGGGNDQIFGQAGNDNLLGGNGDDVLDGGGGNDALSGQAGNDVLRGNIGNDTLSGGGGADFLFGQAGDDLIYGGTGNDLLIGGGGADRLFGQDGNDRIFGGGGADEMYGGNGADLIAGNSEADLADGGAGADTILGDAGNDRLLGAGGDDLLDGGGDDDELFGQADNDRLLGNNGNDLLNGGGGADELFGQAGNDTLDGGTGNDTLGGGGGTDSFVFLAGWGQDAITDFANGVELVNVSGAGVTAGNLNVTTSGTNAIADFGGTDTITFVGQAGNIDISDFIF